MLGENELLFDIQYILCYRYAEKKPGKFGMEGEYMEMEMEVGFLHISCYPGIYIFFAS